MFDARQDPSRRRPFFASAKRLASVVAAGVYLAALAGFLVQSVVGDTALFPLSYFFKWDMFPSHNTRSLRRVAVGLTAAGKFVELHPSPFEQYRGGVHADLARIELDGRGYFFRSTVEQIVSLTNASRPADPVMHVYLFEKSWPAKFNIPPDLYETWSGTPKPDRAAWRLVVEFDVTESGLPSAPARGGGP
jgi:hypothetical protein